MRVVGKSDVPIHELFVRLNPSKPLTGAEIRNAMSGPAPQLFRQIARHDLFLENVAFTMTRGQDLNAAAKLLYFEYSGATKETKKGSLDQFVTDSVRDTKGLELAARKVVDVLDSMSEIFLPGDKLLSSAGVFAVYYWFIRSRSTGDFPFIREFLVRLDSERRANRARATADPNDEDLDQELLQYDRLNRSTGDVKSHEGRFRSLTRRFSKFARQAAATP